MEWLWSDGRMDGVVDGDDVIIHSFIYYAEDFAIQFDSIESNSIWIEWRRRKNGENLNKVCLVSLRNRTEEDGGGGGGGRGEEENISYVAYQNGHYVSVAASAAVASKSFCSNYYYKI